MHWICSLQTTLGQGWGGTGSCFRGETDGQTDRQVHEKVLACCRYGWFWVMVEVEVEPTRAGVLPPFVPSPHSCPQGPSSSSSSSSCSLSLSSPLTFLLLLHSRLCHSSYLDRHSPRPVLHRLPLQAPTPPAFLPAPATDTYLCLGEASPQHVIVGCISPEVSSSAAAALVAAC
jgi:hypothetical protein